MNDAGTPTASTMAQMLRQRFWTRVCYLKTIHAADLIRVHHHAQQNSIPAEEAIIELGLLTEEQVNEILTGERPVLASA